jgi:predicted transposase YdaD
MSWQEAEAMFGIRELKQTRVYQQGVEEGRENEARSLILRLLTRRFGELPESVRSPLNELPLESLEELGEALLDFATLEDVQVWLSVHHQGNEG